MANKICTFRMLYLIR